MEIISAEVCDLSTHGITSDCKVYMLHVRITNVKQRAKEIIDIVANKSWIKNLGVVDQIAYSARSEKTIEKLITDILGKVEDKVTEEFGEYLVSDTAGEALKQVYKHKKHVLAEIWKEQKSGNPGFDFHTESEEYLIAFGEAKFKTTGSPYTVALDQIHSFIEDRKDEMDLADLQKFCGEQSIKNAIEKRKGFIAAFSLNAKDHKTILLNALKCESALRLMGQTELYLIGIEIGIEE